jgi:hypothetical protein
MACRESASDQARKALIMGKHEEKDPKPNPNDDAAGGKPPPPPDPGKHEK